jgi:hypothetical protein
MSCDDQRFQWAMEHFKFHADQRLRAFNFFLVILAALLTAFGFVWGSSIAEVWAFLVPSIGGIVATLFLALDVRNS